ncbi:MAG: cysteine hydrolase, partial [Ruminococcus sp.]|nr:cysteine hydrolase [Ruminococcus sp.]
MEILIVIDMQNDFLTGALGNAQTAAVTEKVCRRVTEYRQSHSLPVIYTMDTHGENYLDTQEGKRLPVPHCIEGTQGWELPDSLKTAIGEGIEVRKGTFGAKDLPGVVEKVCGGNAPDNGNAPDKITLMGVCTDICVISNAMLLKAFFPETEIEIAADCCAGVTPESH